MDKLTKKKAQKWANALRSGKYSQTTSTLQDSEGHCCLGVACELFIPKRKQIRDQAGNLKGGLPSYDHQPNAPEWLVTINAAFVALSDGDHSLSGLNDADNYSFNEIADLIELVYVHGALD